MTYDDYIDVIRRESTGLANAASAVSLKTPVPSCPKWSMDALVTHVAQVQWWVAIMLESRAVERLSWRSVPKPPANVSLVEWFVEATASLVAALRRSEPATPVWTWTPANCAAFWARRQAHEAAVHRWDAQHAVGTAQALAPIAFAADGIDELLGNLPFVTEIFPAFGLTRFVGAGESIQLQCTNRDDRWVIRLGASGLEVEYTRASADVTARGTASNLDLFLWGRVSSAVLEVQGDVALLERLQALTAL